MKYILSNFKFAKDAWEMRCFQKII